MTVCWSGTISQMSKNDSFNLSLSARKQIQFKIECRLKWLAGERQAEQSVCLNKAALVPCLMCIKPSERNITLLSPLVYFGVLPHQATPHIETQSAETNRRIKRRIVWKRGKTHLINLAGTFHSMAVCFTSEFTFTWRWKWQTLKWPASNTKCLTSSTTDLLHSL